MFKKNQKSTTPGLPQINYFSGKSEKYINQLNPGVKNKNAFTLVELIIVITILAILATIAFISFQGYTKSARDGNRLSTVTNISKGLDIYGVQIGSFPEPEGNISSGSLAGVQLVRMGVISDNTSRLLKLNKTPTDPVSGDKYVYGISADNKNYQIGVTLENLESYNGITKTTYADNGSYRAKILGNYKYPLKLGNSLYSLPSLIFSGTGGDLANESNVKFIVDKGENIPYSPNKETLSNTKIISDVLQSITGTGGLTLTGVNISSINASDIKNGVGQTDSLLATFGVTDKDILGKAMFGNGYNNDVSGNNTQTTFTLSSTSVSIGTSVTITNNCINQPTSYTSSNTSVATIVGTTITTIGSGTTNITPVGGDCVDNSAKILTVYKAFLQNCTTASSTSGIIYTDSDGKEIGRVSNTGTTISGNPDNLTCVGNIVVCAGSGTGYIIQACNLGATTVYTNQTYTNTNTDRNSTVNSWAGGLYQWGNNAEISYASTGASQIDTTGYGPGNYYNEALFRVGNTNWSSPQNNNLWGSGGTVFQRQGPCPNGYHIPTGGTTGEWKNLYNAGGWQSVSVFWDAFRISLKIPYVGLRDYTSGLMGSQTNYAMYWSSTIYNTSGAHALTFNNGTLVPDNNRTYTSGAAIRCFKN